MLNNGQKDFFSGIIANPDSIGEQDVEKLQSLIDIFPHMAILRAMLARACKSDHDTFELKLKSAAAYAPDRSILYKIVNTPENLSPAKSQQITFAGLDDLDWADDATTTAEPIAEGAVVEKTEEVERIDTIHPFEEDDHLIESEPAPVEEKEEEVQDKVINHEAAEPVHLPVDMPDDDLENFDEEEYLPAEEEEDTINYFHSPQETTEAIVDTEEEEPVGEYKFSAEIDDEVFDEITGIDDIQIATPVQNPESVVAEPLMHFDFGAEVAEAVAAEEEEVGELVVAGEHSTQEDQSVKEGPEQVYEDEIAEADHVGPVASEEAAKAAEELEYREVKASYTQEQPTLYTEEEPVYLIDNNFGDSMAAALAEDFSVYAVAETPIPQTMAPVAPVAAAATIATAVPVIPEPPVVEHDNSTVSRYNDESMPYTFMWWLDKTRQEDRKSVV